MADLMKNVKKDLNGQPISPKATNPKVSSKDQHDQRQDPTKLNLRDLPNTDQQKATTNSNNQQNGEIVGSGKPSPKHDSMRASVLKLMESCDDLTDILDEKEAKLKAVNKSLTDSVESRKKHVMTGTFIFYTYKITKCCSLPYQTKNIQ